MTASAFVHRFEVAPKPGHADPIGAALERDAAALSLPLTRARATHVYFVQAALSPAQIAAVQSSLLVDPVTETGRAGATPSTTVGSSPVGSSPAGSTNGGSSPSTIIEVHPLPGVMDPVAQSVEAAIETLTGIKARVSTGWRYDLQGLTPAQATTLAERLLANPVIQRIETTPYLPTSFPAAAPHDAPHDAMARSVTLTMLSDEALAKLSRDAHLFLSLDEMKAIQAEYRTLGREPREIELETLAQTWSEHCVHKTFKSTITYRTATGTDDPIDWSNRPGHSRAADGSILIKNLLKSTVAAATFELIKDGLDWTLSVFTDNSGVIAFDDQYGICIKVETHNHPSALEPYGGAATGAGGCIRDVIGTGLGARPIASTDVFCVAHPDGWSDSQSLATAPATATAATQPLPRGTLHPRRVLSQVVAGVRDYGNRMGIPTVNGAVHFDNRYVGNPLVFCGCIGLIPRDKVKGAAKPGDRIIALGGRTGRDGIHGATFSSTELEHTSADEFSHAVQIGNAIEEKRVLEALMQARDHPSGTLYSGMTDCGAGGFSSAIGEMGSTLGAQVHLDRAPLKYAGLSPVEIWISEAQERMVLAVPPANLPALQQICHQEGVELADLGHFGTPGEELILLYRGTEMGRMKMHFVHEGIPMPTREARWTLPAAKPATPSIPAPAAGAALLALLRHPTIASKHWIVRQYDHEVRGSTVIKPLVGPTGRGPGDASVLEPIPGSNRGIAIGCGLQTPLGDGERAASPGDPYLMALAAIDEAVRNVVCVGADPTRIAILDNFSWPSCSKPENLAALVRAAEGCYDGAKAYRTPFVSGKDSLNNQLTIPATSTAPARTIQIPPTLLITALGIVPRLDRCLTMDAKRNGNLLVLVGETAAAMGGSHYELLYPAAPLANPAIPRVDLARGPRTARAVAGLIALGLVASAHDCSEGGLAVAVAEMLIAGSTKATPIGAELNLGALAWSDAAGGDANCALFTETPSRYVLEVESSQVAEVVSLLGETRSCVIGRLTSSGRLVAPIAGLDEDVEALAAAWRGPLDW